MDAKQESPEEIDFSYSPVPEEGRSRNDSARTPKTVLVIGALGKATDPPALPATASSCSCTSARRSRTRACACSG